MPIGAGRVALLGAAGIPSGVDYWVPIMNATLGSSTQWWDITSSGSDEAWSNFQDIVITGRFKLSRDWNERLWYRINSANNNFEWTAFNQMGVGYVNRLGGTSGNLLDYQSGTPGSHSAYIDIWSSVIVRLTGLNDYSTIGTSCNVMIETQYGDLASAGSHSHLMAINETIGTTAPTSFSFGFGSAGGSIAAGCTVQVYGIKGAD